MRFAAIAFLTVSLIQPVSAQQPANKKSVPSMVSITPYQHGVQALADQLPEIAVSRFQDAYKIKGLEDAQNREILYKLTEAQVRANQPEAALITLKSKFFDNHPEREFWIAQAYAAQGKYLEAIEHFKSLDKSSSYTDAARLSLASIQLALDFQQDAVDNFLIASNSKDVITRLKATATLAEIYLENGDLINAQKMISTIPKGPKSALLGELLEAKLAFAEKNYTDAIAKYSSLFENENQVHPRIYQIALLGLADARHATGQKKEAMEGLISFVEEHQESPVLLPIFERISVWTPLPVTKNSEHYQQLQSWAGRNEDDPNVLPQPKSSEFITPSFPPPATLQTVSENLKAIALYYYAKQTAQLNDAGSLAKAQFEFSSFRLAYPRHHLFGSSLLETAKIELLQGRRTQALNTLQTLVSMVEKKKVQLNSAARSKAGFIAGLLSVEAQNYPEALEAFEIASRSNIKEITNSATINAGLAALRSSNLSAFDAQKNKISDKELRTQLEIERALWLAHQMHEGAREALSNFLFKNPDNKRAVDARIALASICATQAPLDPLLCKALLETIEGSELTENQQTDFTRTSYQLAELQQEWPAAIVVINNFLRQYPNSPDASEFTMRMGIALYRNGEHNKARQLLVKIALDQPESPLTPFCYYFAGMAARLEGTPQALKESIDIFEKVIASKSALTTEARIQQARVLLDVNRTEEAKISLNQVYNPKSDSAQQREIGILLATALHTQGSENIIQYSKAIAIYDQLLKLTSLPLSWSNQLHYMKGHTLESMGDQAAAIDTYYRVINRENQESSAARSQQQEWKWFYQCGFKAIALLEKNKQYRAAVAVAKKMASYGGPESDTYRKRARSLEMEHMIWEE